MLSPQGLRQRSRLADNSPGGTLIKQEASDSYTPGEGSACGLAAGRKICALTTMHLFLLIHPVE